MERTMNHKTFKHILAKQKGCFRDIVDKIEELKRLNELLSLYLEADLAPHCQVANFRSGCLVIQVDSSVWAMRLRYLFPDLLSRLRYEARLVQLVSLHCIVRQYVDVEKSRRTSPPSQLSSVGKYFLEDLKRREEHER